MLVLTQPPLCITTKGFIQPHRNHLPRRHRQQQKPAPPKLTLDSPVFLPVPFPMSPIANHHHSPAQPSPPPTRTGPIQPHISHLPRRRRLHTRHYHALAPIRRKKRLERDMCMQRVSSGVWVAFCPHRDGSSPYSSEDDIDEGYRCDEGEEGVWDKDKGLEERFGRIVRIVDADNASPSPGPSSGLTLTLESTRESADDGVALLTDAQIREGCAFLRTPPSPPAPRYSSFPPPHPPRGKRNTKEGVLILAPRTRAADALSLAAAYVVATRGWEGVEESVHTPPRTPNSSSVLLPNIAFPALSASVSSADTRYCEATTTPPSTGHPSSNPNSNSDAQEEIDLDLDMTHPIAEWSARVVPCPPLPLPLQLDNEEEGEYTPIHTLLMRLHDSNWDRAGEGEEEGEEGEEEEEGGLRDEWRGLISWEGMWRVWECVRSLRGA